MNTITADQVRAALSTVIDPELGVNIVDLGLIYHITVEPPDEATKRPVVHIIMTLTTPGCPLAGVLDQMVKDSLSGFTEIEVEQDVFVELTFDPPWIPDMMSAEAKAELGFD